MDKLQEIAWCAGLFEGEGCIGLRKPKGGRCYPWFILHSTDEDVVRLFHARIGYGRVTGPHQPRQAHHKPQWTWYCSSMAHFFAVAELLRPYLCRRRLARLDEVIDCAGDKVADVEAGIPAQIRHC